tara:strand:- start:25370 stop:26383 length:1014 start_codon:yes stop_codon:yes gene_type:complete
MVYDPEENRYSPLEDWRAKRIPAMHGSPRNESWYCRSDNAKPVQPLPHLWQIVIESILPDLMAKEPEKMLDLLLNNESIRAKFVDHIANNSETRQLLLPHAAASEKIKDVSVIEKDEIVEVIYPECFPREDYENAPTRIQILKMRFGDLPYKLQAGIERLMRNAAQPLPCLNAGEGIFSTCPVSEHISFNASRCCINCQLNTQVPEMTLDNMPVIPVFIRTDVLPIAAIGRRDTTGNVTNAYIEEVKSCAFDNDIEPDSVGSSPMNWIATPDTLLWDAHMYALNGEESIIEEFERELEDFFDVNQLHMALVQLNKVVTHAPDEVWVRKPRLRLEVFD